MDRWCLTYDPIFIKWIYLTTYKKLQWLVKLKLKKVIWSWERKRQSWHICAAINNRLQQGGCFQQLCREQCIYVLIVYHTRPWNYPGEVYRLGNRSCTHPTGNICKDHYAPQLFKTRYLVKSYFQSTSNISKLIPGWRRQQTALEKCKIS